MNDMEIRDSGIFNQLRKGLDNKNLMRGGLLPEERISYVPSLAGVWGLLLGGYQGGKMEGYRYMAEQQHKLPKNIDGWYFYHKRKNYKVMLEAIKQGSKLAGKLILLCSGYEAVQYSCDVLLFDSKNSFISSTVAGFTSASLFSLFTKLPKQSSLYALVAGTGFGLVAGGMQHFIDKYKNLENKEEA